jgi:hypothetical protein
VAFGSAGFILRGKTKIQSFRGTLRAEESFFSCV